jgi:hypothetical protein
MSADHTHHTLLGRLWRALVRFFQPSLDGQVVTRMGTRPSP